MAFSVSSDIGGGDTSFFPPRRFALLPGFAARGVEVLGPLLVLVLLLDLVSGDKALADLGPSDSDFLLRFDEVSALDECPFDEGPACCCFAPESVEAALAEPRLKADDSDDDEGKILEESCEKVTDVAKVDGATVNNEEGPGWFNVASLTGPCSV
jgi:hypothetical protein